MGIRRRPVALWALLVAVWCLLVAVVAAAVGTLVAVASTTAAGLVAAAAVFAGMVQGPSVAATTATSSPRWTAGRQAHRSRQTLRRRPAPGRRPQRFAEAARRRV